MEYLAHFAAFLVAVFGVAGDTWDPEKPSILKFTPLGWLIGVLALIILGLAFRIAYVTDTEKRTAKEQRQAVQTIAEMEVCIAALRYKVVLDVLHATATGSLTEDGSDVGFSFEELVDEQNIEKVRILNLMSNDPSRPIVGDSRSVSTFVSEEIQEFVDLINLALAKYSSFLNKELILDAIQLSSLNLTRRFLVTDEQVEQVRKSGQEAYPGLWPHEIEEYPKAIGLLASLLVKTGMAQEMLVCEKPEFF